MQADLDVLTNPKDDRLTIKIPQKSKQTQPKNKLSVKKDFQAKEKLTHTV